MNGAQKPYDEDQIRLELSRLPDDCRVAFACAMGELLMPTAYWLSTGTNRGDAPALRVALDVAWSFANGATPLTTEIDEARRVAESLVPDDQDEDWTTLSPLVQNAAASVAYALRACLSPDPEEAVWAARQVYEAADYLVQLTAPDQSYTEDPTSEPMSIALRAIEVALNASGSSSFIELRQCAATNGAEFLNLLDPG